MRFVLLILTVCTIEIPVALADERPTPATLSEQVDSLFAEYDKPNSPGCAVGVIRHGELIYSRGFGSANLDHEVANTPSTIFNVGSVAKSFTSACIAILLDQGRITPDDDIRMYLPELHRFDPPIRIRHVIRCRDGIWAQWHVQQLAGWPAEPREAAYEERDLLTLLAGQKTLPFEPGSEFQYGTSGFFLLGVIVKRVTGLTLAAFAEEQLFSPLHMSNTFYLDQPQQIVKHRATGYYRDDDLRATDRRWVQWTQNSSATGGRGLYSTVEDLHRWDRALSERHLRKGLHMTEFVEQGTLLDNRNVLDNNPTGEYRGLKRIQFTGGLPGFSAAITRFPEQRFTVICLSNNGRLNPSRLNSRIADIYLADQLEGDDQDTTPAEPQPNRVVDVTARELREKVGAYRIEGDGRIWQIVLEGDSLRVIDQLNRSLPLTLVGKDRFRPEGGFFDEDQRFVFKSHRPGEPPALKSTWPERSVSTKRVMLVEPNDAQLNEYVGQYHSDELSTTYRMRADGGQLLLRVNNLGWEPLEPTVHDEFIPAFRQLHDNRIFNFARNDDGDVDGLSVRLWRVRGIEFTKQE